MTPIVKVIKTLENIRCTTIIAKVTKMVSVRFASNPRISNKPNKKENKEVITH